MQTILTNASFGEGMEAGTDDGFDFSLMQTLTPEGNGFGKSSGKGSTESYLYAQPDPRPALPGPAGGGCGSFPRPTAHKLPIPASWGHTLIPLLATQTLQQLTETPGEFSTAQTFRGMHLAQQRLNTSQSAVRNRPASVKHVIAS